MSSRQILVALLLVSCVSTHRAEAQSVQTIRCPVSSPYKCIATHETCGWRNERATAEELEDAKRNTISLAFPCPTLPNGVKMELCWIDRVNYCKSPSAADIARAEQAKREREEKARQEKLAAERKAAEVARETQRLGSHREAEARRLVEMREAAAKARGGSMTGSPRPPGRAGESQKVCTSAPFRTTPTSRFKTTEADARTDFARDAAGLCRNNTGNPGYSAGALSCVREDVSVWGQMPVAQLTKRPANDPPRFEFKCSAPVVCTAPKESCKTVGTVKSSGQ